VLEIGEQVETEVNLKETFNSVNTLNKTQNQLEAHVLKLLGQMSPNYCEMVISGPLSELCLVSTCNLHARLSPSADIGSWVKCFKKFLL
jgi:hypothetical protein